jgi:hypothetical protein
MLFIETSNAIQVFTSIAMALLHRSKVLHGNLFKIEEVEGRGHGLWAVEQHQRSKQGIQ